MDELPAPFADAPPEDTGNSSALGPRGETVALLLCALPLSRSRSLSLLFWSAEDAEDALWLFSCPVFEELEPEAVVEEVDAEEPERGYGGEIVPERVRREVVAEEEADADAGFAEVGEELD